MNPATSRPPSWRGWLLRVHRWLGLSLGLLVALFAAAGSVLVWADEIEAWQAGSPAATAPAGPPRWQAVLDQARATAPLAAAWVINPAHEPGGPAEVVAEPAQDGQAPRLLAIDMETGALLEETRLTDTAIGWLFHFHTRLLSDGWGQPLVLSLALVLLAFVISGIVLWWPRRWAQALALRLDRGRTVALWDLHRVTGVVAAALLLLSIGTGVLLLFPSTAVRAVDGLAGAQTRGPAPVAAPPSAALLSLDLLVAKAQAALPAGSVTRIIVPAAPAAWTVRMRIDNETHPNGLSFVRLDPYTGAIQHATPWNESTPGVAMFSWVYPLHIGLLGGVVHKLALTLLGLLPTLLLVTGVWLWWRKRARPQASSAAGGSAKSQARLPG